MCECVSRVSKSMYFWYREGVSFLISRGCVSYVLLNIGREGVSWLVSAERVYVMVSIGREGVCHG